MKSFLITIVRASFLLFLLFGLSEVEAATVKRVLKKRGVIMIDEGKDAGFTRGKKVCFFNDDKQVACGKVRKTTSNKAYVRVARKQIRKIKPGMEARLPDGGSSGSSSTSSSAGGSSSKYMTNVKVGYYLSPLMPASYQKISYLRPKGSPPTLWNQTKPASLSFLGFGGEFEYGLSSSLSLAAGARIKMYGDFTSQADYNEVDTKYAETTISAKSLGVWFDAYYYNIVFSPSFILRIGNGLDIDMSTVDVTSTQKSDTGEADVPIASASSKLNVISLRTNIGFHYFLDPIGLDLGMNFLLPIAAMGASFSGDVPDANASDLGVDPVKDLKVALDHKKASFGLEIVMAGYFAF